VAEYKIRIIIIRFIEIDTLWIIEGMYE
jgi:hypothetical protein